LAKARQAKQLKRQSSMTEPTEISSNQNVTSYVKPHLKQIRKDLDEVKEKLEYLTRHATPAPPNNTPQGTPYINFPFTKNPPTDAAAPATPYGNIIGIALSLMLAVGGIVAKLYREGAQRNQTPKVYI
jgi:hypothetical protein